MAIKLEIEGAVFWTPNLDALVEAGILFACIGKLRPKGREFDGWYICQLWHAGDTDRLKKKFAQ